MNRERYEHSSDRLRLTPRQFAVAELIVQGLASKEVGARLFLTEETVKSHLKNIYTKLHVTNRMELLQAMVQVGLIPCPFCTGET